MRKLVLVKHSEALVDARWPPAAWHLSPDGRVRCASLAALLRPHEPQTLAVSAEPKAVETAEVLGTHLRLVPKITSDLHEQRVGGSALLSRSRFEAAVADCFARPDEVVFGEESAAAARERFSAAIDAVLASTTGNQLVVAHGRVISLFVAAATATDPMELWSRLGLPSFVVLSVPEFELLEVVEGVE